MLGNKAKASTRAAGASAAEPSLCSWGQQRVLLQLSHLCSWGHPYFSLCSGNSLYILDVLHQIGDLQNIFHSVGPLTF